VTSASTAPAAADTPDHPALGEAQARIERVLDAWLPPASGATERLHAAMRYSTLGGGKRLRPALVYATGRMLGVADEVLDVPAAAVELIHVYSLIHDDLPSMDDDDLRRGRPTCHMAFDEATALLAGDALQTLAFDVLARRGPAALGVAARLAMVGTLSRAAGAGGMAGGQAIDLGAVGQRLDAGAVEQMHRLKTGALLAGAIELAAHAAPALTPHESAWLQTFGEQLGFAFQIVDDLLDVEGDAALLGKATGADAARHKPTYPAAVGIPFARAKAAELAAAALAALAPFGAAGRELESLARFVIRRDR
jgi:geranylgeranyl pyrophosphate synthase